MTCECARLNEKQSSPSSFSDLIMCISLGAYYTYIHPYFPVLPPPEPLQVNDNPDTGIRRAPDAIFSSKTGPDYEPSTPLTMAISALLALIPHPDDPDPSGTDSVHLRREQAQAFAHSAFEGVETESELPDSVTQPGDALSSHPKPLNQATFHPQNSLENESIIALLLLSTYEYAQRGNIAKMRNRAGQALNAALNLGLHSKGDESGYCAEANRRVWWMTVRHVTTTVHPLFAHKISICWSVKARY